MGLEARDGEFWLDGRCIRLLSGAVHYFRVVRPYWRDRLLKIKACGLNCVETYVPWNKHEPVRGEFQFEGMLDLRAYIELAHELGLYVIFRPGPYICSEWDFGGLPSWLLSDPSMKVRSSYGPYLEAVERYLEQVLTLVKDLQHSDGGGPIIAMQLENEYGSYGQDAVYTNFLKQTFAKYGARELLFTSDNGMGVQRGQIPGVLMTYNFQERGHGELMFEYVSHVKQPGMPFMVMEFWSGWFDHWGEKHHVWPLQEFESTLEWLLGRGSSVNFYMFHGGTNFGFMNGANEGLGASNDSKREEYQPDITSYDYDCLVSESGQLTPKWFATKRILQKLLPDQVSAELPDPPDAIPSIAYGEVRITEALSLDCLLAIAVQGITSDKVLPMESLPINNGGGQGHGFIVYRAKVNGCRKLKFTGKVRDRAVILVDGQHVDVVDCSQDAAEVDLPANGDVMNILVENMSRVNYADFESPVMNTQRKGLQDEVLLDGKAVNEWTIFPLEFDSQQLTRARDSERWVDVDESTNGYPALYRGQLHIEQQPQDTFIDMTGWTKGNVFVNGFNLGRYWEIGPQQTLYIPAPLLHTGSNEICIFEQHRHRGRCVQLTGAPSLGDQVVQHTETPASMKALVLLLRAATRLGPWTWKLLKLVIK